VKGEDFKAVCLESGIEAGGGEVTERVRAERGDERASTEVVAHVIWDLPG
jgi:hypothetical protein